jgi:His/Glu/Gln/Arg/opine family amino acid ABC transporter permease subunit
MKNKKILLIVGIVLAVLIAVTALILFTKNELYAAPITLEEAQTIIDESFEKSFITDASKSVAALAQLTELEAVSLDYGSNKNILVSCNYTGVDVKKLWEKIGDELLSIPTVDEKGRAKVALKISLDAVKLVLDTLENDKEAYVQSGEITVEIYEKEGEYLFWNSRDFVNTVFSGALDIKIERADGETVQTPLMKGIQKALIPQYEKNAPDVSTGLMSLWNNTKATFKLNFIDDARWQYIAKGLLITLRITAISVVIGIVLGFLVAIIRTTHDKTGKMRPLNWICKLYLTVIRGTPVIVQLMIIYFVILMPLGVEKMIAAYVCFGINSGAYVAEIIRGGIMAVDAGQMEAGRSLGFNYVQTMWYIVIPQTIKAVLPALANEFIVLLKESSVASYIGIVDLTQGGNIIRGVTYSAFMPLVAVALIYLALVMGLSKLVTLLERRLNKSDRG